ncbi:X-box-binding protein 1 [Exaiptasia diaphana]|uniref:X-box-binding protein 1 n=1 Tax=Exaiptasia diaphana TaxID=2652724 RepID=A0A913Y8K4_EXADI|nr:X-box-binding protein 1 [Exaiptasia diaphana]KXJ21891.1 X-box-binding protein 1 [Exaiptasia diaphana]
MESPNINREAVLKSLALNETNSEGQPRKRRRLDNLTAEERALRRKLKNRVAAQTARDRKKARMQDLEDAVKRLERENKNLRDSNKRLLKQTDSLSSENSELRIRLGLTPPVSPEASPSPLSLPPSPEPSLKDETDSSLVVIKKEAESKEFAALTASQQQKNLILFLLVITTWLRINSSLSCLLVCLKMLTPVVKMIQNFSSQSKNTRLFPLAVVDPALMTDRLKSSQLETKMSRPYHKELMVWWGRQQTTWNPLMIS